MHKFIKSPRSKRISYRINRRVQWNVEKGEYDITTSPPPRDHIVNVCRDRLKPFRKFACKYITVFFTFFFFTLSRRNNPYLLRYFFIFYRYRISHSLFPLILSTLNTYTHACAQCTRFSRLRPVIRKSSDSDDSHRILYPVYFFVAILRLRAMSDRITYSTPNIIATAIIKIYNN